MKLLSAISISGLLLAVCGCKDDDRLPKEPAYLAGNTITITNIAGIPQGLTFDKVKADIQGVKWKVVASVEGPYLQGQIVLTLPAGFPTDDLQQAKQTKENRGGCWPATLSDPEALVASLGDLNAFSGEKKVGRIYLTNWSGEGSKAGKAFISYHYTDRPFTISGQNLNLNGSPMFKPSFEHTLNFKAGWNAYATIDLGNLMSLRTTTLPDETQLLWQFEAH
jgi:hypothetical protein